jgi:hypothetical protein
MVGFQMPGLVAAGVLAHSIADQQRPPQRLTEQPPGPPESQHFAVLVDHRTQQSAVAGMLLRGRRLNGTDTGDVAYGLRRLGRSRGNVFGQVCRLRRAPPPGCGPHRSDSGALLRKPPATSTNRIGVAVTAHTGGWFGKLFLTRKNVPIRTDNSGRADAAAISETRSRGNVLSRDRPRAVGGLVRDGYRTATEVRLGCGFMSLGDG